MERGFFHASRGYWQTTDDVPAHILATYPEGTIEVPLKPGADYQWQGQWLPIAPSLPTVEDLLAALAARRFQAEEAGTIFAGYPLATDRTTQAKITAAYVKATADPDYTIEAWKFAPGVFAALDAETIIAAANAMEAHVQTCFSKEAALTAQILAAETPEALAAIDLEQGWP